MPVDVRVGIVSWNTAALLDRALASLPEALGDLVAEVVVVDNASSDASTDVVRGHTGVRLLGNPSNVGYSRAMNQALAGTEARALIALNPDTVAPPRSLSELVATLDEHPDAGLAAPLLAGPDGTCQISVYPYPGVLHALETGFLPHRLRRDSGARGRAHVRKLRKRWVVGAVHCIRRAALGAHPPYSERWFMYAEDIEICWRLEKAGWCNLLRQDVTVVHDAHSASKQRWGQGVGLELQTLDSIYGWIASDRSLLQARATAFVNRTSIMTKQSVLRAGAAVSPSHRQQWRDKAGTLSALGEYHGRVLRGEAGAAGTSAQV
jgi:N-acetylglucosaminyl-diphospho-decaprenol L-rhamnosyltransferase